MTNKKIKELFREEYLSKTYLVENNIYSILNSSAKTEDGVIDKPQSIDWYKRELITKHIIPKIQHEPVLDIGCGDGETIKILKDQGFEVMGLEFSLERCKRVRKDIVVINADANELPFDDNSFGTVICLALLEHLVDPYTFLKQLKKIVKKNGDIIVLVPNTYDLLEMRYVNKRLQKGQITNLVNVLPKGHRFAYNPQYLIRILSHNGFQPISLNGWVIRLPFSFARKWDKQSKTKKNWWGKLRVWLGMKYPFFSYSIILHAKKI